MKLEIYNIQGEGTKKEVELPDAVFGIEPNDHAIWLDVKRILAAARQGTHASLNRGTMSGSTRKLKRQKGTGGARAGDIKSPLFRGGGRIFGPQPRDYSMKINKKVTKIARKSALTYKAKESKIIVIEDFTIESAKTKEYFEILKNLKLNKKKNLLITAENDNNLKTAVKNIPRAFICEAENLNTYAILNNETLVITESALEVINKTLN